jgi:hypothetical protein
MRRFLALAGASLIGCSDILPRACTLIGCDHQLLVAFETPPSGAVRVEALEDGATSPRVIECPVGSCSFGARFTDFTPAHVVITVITDQGSKQFDLQPEYEQVRPNGRDCPPECTQARVVVSLP